MVAPHSAPKQWSLSKEETLNSFKAWKDNLLYILSVNTDFAPFLAAGFTWLKDNTGTANRGFTDDLDTVEEARRKTAVQKVVILRLLLGQIANFATTIARNQIVKNSVSLDDIWSKIREHYGFQCTGSRFLSLTNIQLQPAERPEDLYQRLISFFDDNLVTTTGLTHHGVLLTSNEVVTPTIENTIVLLWLERINSGLPALVQQKYGAELRNKTLASLKSEISLALQSLLNELEHTEDSRILRSQISRFSSPSPSPSSQSYRLNQNKRKCCLCESAERPGYDTHYLSQCRYLPEGDRKRMLKFRSVDIADEAEDEIHTIDSPIIIDHPAPVVNRRISTRRSPYMDCMYQQLPARLCLDTGSESNLVSNRYATFSGMKIHMSRQGAVQADEATPLIIVGEVKDVRITRGSHIFEFDALVTKEDVGDIIAGEPFLEVNDIALRPAKKQIIIQGRDIVPYNSGL
jgi:hypothetical protein